MKSPSRRAAITDALGSILKGVKERYWFITFRLMIGHQPPCFLGTRNKGEWYPGERDFATSTALYFRRLETFLLMVWKGEGSRGGRAR